MKEAIFLAVLAKDIVSKKLGTIESERDERKKVSA